MSYNIETIPTFDKQFKRLSKKYSSLKNDLLIIIESLSENPTLGIDLGNGFYKIRIAIKSKNKGKSGGGRLVTFVKISNETIYLSLIFDKSEKSTLSDSELDLIFKTIP